MDWRDDEHDEAIRAATHDELIALLRHDDPKLRHDAIAAIAGACDELREPPLTPSPGELAGDYGPAVTRVAVGALRGTYPPDSDDTRALMAAANVEDYDDLGRCARDALPELVLALTHRSWMIQAVAADVLAEYGSAEAEHLWPAQAVLCLAGTRLLALAESGWGERELRRHRYLLEHAPPAWTAVDLAIKRVQRAASAAFDALFPSGSCESLVAVPWTVATEADVVSYLPQWDVIRERCGARVA